MGKNKKRQPGANMQTLQEKHRALDAQIAIEQRRPAPDTCLIQKLKKQKLQLKEQIEAAKISVVQEPSVSSTAAPEETLDRVEFPDSGDVIMFHSPRPAVAAVAPRLRQVVNG